MPQHQILHKGVYTVVDIISILRTKQYLKNSLLISNDSYETEFELRNGDVIPLQLDFIEGFPYKLPTVWINTNKQAYIPNKPHITSNGYICYLDKEGVVWNDTPSITVDYIFERVEKVLLYGIKEKEFHKEFMYYFASTKGCKYAISLINSDSVAKEIKLIVDKNGSPRLFYDNDVKNINKIKKDSNIEVNQVCNGIYIPLEKTLDIYVPNSYKFWSREEISNIIYRCCSMKTIDTVNRLTKERNHHYYILNIPLLTGENVLIGLWYSKLKSKKGKDAPIMDKESLFDIKPVSIFRVDDERLLKRGGAITDGKASSILLVGCGSVGSDLLFLLTRSGYKNFTIVDNDNLEVDNTYRHFLGYNKSSKFLPKVELLKTELDERYKELEIKSINKDIFDVLKTGEVDINKFNLVISAIGDVNQERLLNKYIVRTNIPAIFTWVEAYGIGGHALLINNQSIGCYNCYINDDLTNKINFAGKSDKPFVNNIDGCLGTFTQYGSMDSMQTANIAGRLVLDFLQKMLKVNKIVSWKGDSEEFISKGYELSDAYYEFDVGIGERYIDIGGGCKNCNG
jgi:molybdopterin/thiamine biosynthesis adenylyltransferase